MVVRGIPDLSAQAIPGARFAVRATPRARRNALEQGDPIRIHVTDPPEDGRANTAVRALLAVALGVAPTRLVLLRGATAREKLFQLDDSSGVGSSGVGSSGVRSSGAGPGRNR